MSQIVHGKPQLPPGICFICELSNPVDYIDTLRDYESSIGREKLDGRKYLCAECIADAALKLGYTLPGDTDQLLLRLSNAKAIIADLKKQLEAYESLKASLTFFDVNTTTAAAPSSKTTIVKA